MTKRNFSPGDFLCGRWFFSLVAIRMKNQSYLWQVTCTSWEKHYSKTVKFWNCTYTLTINGAHWMRKIGANTKTMPSHVQIFQTHVANSNLERWPTSSIPTAMTLWQFRTGTIRNLFAQRIPYAACDHTADSLILWTSWTYYASHHAIIMETDMKNVIKKIQMSHLQTGKTFKKEKKNS